MAEIYQSSQVSVKADIAVENPFLNFREFDADRALAEGLLYFGVVGRDGGVPENRKRVYALLESGGAVTLPQPVKLSAGGQPSYNGNPVQIAVDGSYSLKVCDKDGVKEYFAPKVTAKSLLGYSGMIPEEVKTVNSTTVKFDVIEATTASFYVSTDSGAAFNGRLMVKGVDYSVIDESTIQLISTYTPGSRVVGRVLDPTGSVVNVASGTDPIYIYDKKSDVLGVDLSAGDSVILNGSDFLGDGSGASYIVGSTTNPDDGYNTITLDNGLQLNIKKSYQALQSYTETATTTQLSNGVVTFDVKEASVAKIELTESVTSIELINISEVGESKIEIKVTQDAVGSHTLAWIVNGQTPKAAGGTLPTVTSTAGAVDRFILLTDDGGDTFELYTAGQDIK